MSLGFQNRPAPLRLSGCASNSRGKDSNAVSENAVDCENTELFAGWIDLGGTRHRELLFCGSEVALNSDVAAFVVGSDMGEDVRFWKRITVAGGAYSRSCTDSHCCLPGLTNHNQCSERGNTKACLGGT